mgnify:CR=1 FL=1
MKICLCQFDIIWENKQGNKQKIQTLVSGLEKTQVDLLIFPETTLTGFSFNEITVITREDIAFFADIAKTYNTHVCFGGIYDNKNMCFSINPEGTLISQTGKIHLFSPSGEQAYHLPERTITSFTIGNTRLTPFIVMIYGLLLYSGHLLKKQIYLLLLQTGLKKGQNTGRYCFRQGRLKIRHLW